MEMISLIRCRSRRVAIAVAFVMAMLGFEQALANKCVAASPGLASMQPASIVLINDRNESLTLNVLVADDNGERAAGFQHICPDVIDRTMILFVYASEFAGRFHMQNVHAPLDIAFFDSAGNVVDTLRMQTYTDTSKPIYGPGNPFQYALEARAGFFAENAISAGSSRLQLREAVSE